MNAFLHAHQAEVAWRWGAGRIKALPVILNGDPDTCWGKVHRDADMIRLRMLGHVRQRFLYNAEDGGGARVVQRTLFACDKQGARDFPAQREVFRQPFQCGQQAEIEGRRLVARLRITSMVRSTSLLRSCSAGVAPPSGHFMRN